MRPVPGTVAAPMPALQLLLTTTIALGPLLATPRNLNAGDDHQLNAGARSTVRNPVKLAQAAARFTYISVREFKWWPCRVLELVWTVERYGRGNKVRVLNCRSIDFGASALSGW